MTEFRQDSVGSLVIDLLIDFNQFKLEDLWDGAFEDNYHINRTTPCHNVIPTSHMTTQVMLEATLLDSLKSNRCTVLPPTCNDKTRLKSFTMCKITT